MARKLFNRRGFIVTTQLVLVILQHLSSLPGLTNDRERERKRALTRTPYPYPLPVPQICARGSDFCIAGAAMEYTFGYGYGYVHEHVYVHDARLVQLFIIGAPKYCVIFGSNGEFAE